MARRADEINGWLFIYSDRLHADGIRFGIVMITLAEQAPAEVREAYELARTPAHLRRYAPGEEHSHRH